MLVTELTGLFALASPIASKTLRMYVADISLVCRWYEHEYRQPLDSSDLTPELVIRYRLWCMNRLSPGTFNRRRTALNKLCAWAIQQKLFTINPVSEVPCAK